LIKEVLILFVVHRGWTKWEKLTSKHRWTR